MAELQVNKMFLGETPIFGGAKIDILMQAGASSITYARIPVLKKDLALVSLNPVLSITCPHRRGTYGDDEFTLRIPLTKVGAEPAFDCEKPGDPVDDENSLWYVICTDKRNELSTTNLEKAYNVNDSSLEHFYSSTVASETETSQTKWTWSDLIADIGDVVMIDSAPDSWDPRNVIFDSVPKSVAIDYIAAELWMIAGYNFVDDAVEMYDPGTISSDNALLLTQAKPYTLNNIGDTEDKVIKSGAITPGSLWFQFPLIKVDRKDQLVEGSRFYKSVQDSDNPNSVGEKSLHYPTHIMINREGKNDEDLVTEYSAVADDVATRAYRYVEAPMGYVEYAGLWQFHPDGYIQAIRWIVDDQRGVKTCVWINNCRHYSALKQMDRKLFLVANSFVTGIGDIFAHKSGASGNQVIFMKPPLRSGVAKVVSVDDGGSHTITEVLWGDGAWVPQENPPYLVEVDEVYDYRDDADEAAENDYVIFWQEYTTSGTVRTWIDTRNISDEIHWFVATNTWSENGINLDTVTAHECEPDGANEDEDTDYLIYFREVDGMQPNVQAGDTFGAIFNAFHGRWFCVSDAVYDEPIGAFKIVGTNLSNVRHGWVIANGEDDSTTNFCGCFLVGYDPDEADYNSVGKTGGYKVHGTTENNHIDHIISPLKCIYGTIGSYDVVYDISVTTNSSAGAFHTDTDNRPPFAAIPIYERVE